MTTTTDRTYRDLLPVIVEQEAAVLPDGCDSAWANLSGVDLTGAYLTGARGMDASGPAYLTGARGMDTSVPFRSAGADLTGAYLTGARGMDASRWTLTNAGTAVRS